MWLNKEVEVRKTLLPCLYSKNNYNTGTQNTGSRVLRTSIRLNNDKLPEAHMKIQKSRRGRQVNVNADALLHTTSDKKEIGFPIQFSRIHETAKSSPAPKMYFSEKYFYF